MMNSNHDVQWCTWVALVARAQWQQQQHVMCSCNTAGVGLLLHTTEPAVAQAANSIGCWVYNGVAGVAGGGACVVICGGGGGGTCCCGCAPAALSTAIGGGCGGCWCAAATAVSLAGGIARASEGGCCHSWGCSTGTSNAGNTGGKAWSHVASSVLYSCRRCTDCGWLSR